MEGELNCENHLHPHGKQRQESQHFAHHMIEENSAIEIHLHQNGGHGERLEQRAQDLVHGQAIDEQLVHSHDEQHGECNGAASAQ